MNKYGMKVAACALAGTLSLSGYQMTLEARINNASSVPAAGIAVVLDEGSTIQDLQVEVVQNIAYLESASGLQPNIVLASEKIALADSPVNVMGMNHKTADKTLVQEFVDAVNESETELAETISTEEEEKEEAVQTTSTEETNNTEASDDIAESDDTEETTQVIETEESTETEEDFQTSVGFPSTEIYDEAETEEETGTEIETEEETTEEAETETQEDAQDFSGLVIARVSNYVNVRSMPSEEGEIVGKLYDKSVGEFIEEKDGWYKITSGSCT